MRFLDRITSCFHRFGRDRHAGIAPTFGLLLIPMLGLMGFAVDLSSMYAERTRAHNIADAGAIDALRIVQDYMNTNGNTQATFNYIEPIAQANAISFMKGMADQDKNLVGPATSVTLTYAKGTVTSKADVDFNFKPAFMGIFAGAVSGLLDVSNVAVSTDSVATSQLAKYTQVIFLVDVSGSMGVAATDKDMQNMVDLTSGLTNGAVACGFACHQDPNNFWGYAPIDFRAATKQANIKSKIDYAVLAVQDFTNRLISESGSAPGHFATAVYTFGGQLKAIQPSTTDLSNVNTVVGNIDLELYADCPGGTCGGWTYLTNSLQSLKKQINNVGDGSSPSSMITYLILVTDGVEDIYNPGAVDTHQTDTSWTSVCTAIKDMGVNVATVQAQYPPITYGTDFINYTNLVQPIAAQIAPAMQRCASSSDLALSASDGPGIETAVDALFATISSSPRLTN